MPRSMRICWPGSTLSRRARLEDRSTAIRQLVDQALRDLSKREALQAYEQGRLTLRELARTLRLDVWAAQDLLAAEGVAVAQGGRGEIAAAMDGLLSARRDPAQTPSAD